MITEKLTNSFLERTIPEPNTGCWLWTGAFDKNSGYGDFTFQIKRVKKGTKAHRLSWMIFRGPIADGEVVRHFCNNTWCVNPEHLSVGTQQDNIDDKVRAGRQDRGESHGCSKLTEREVLEIRSSAGTLSSIGERFGVSRSMVSRIKKKKNWTHL